MPVNARIIKTKIKSVKNTKKITKAMEMIASVKLRKAVKRAEKARSYLENLQSSVDKILITSVAEDIYHELLLDPKNSKAPELLIVITANKGLCGNYNHAILAEFQKQLEIDSNKAIVAVGKKSAIFSKNRQLNLVEVYQDFSDEISEAEISPIITSAVTGYLSGNYSGVKIIYTKYESALVRSVETFGLLPMLSPQKNNSQNSEKETPEDKVVVNNSEVIEISEDEVEFVFEPDRDFVIDYALRRLIAVKTLQAFLEASASEHSARMVAMKNATDAAGDMIDELSLEYNKSRQAAITQEIAEIANAAAAVS